jgi:hypothetical protein
MSYEECSECGHSTQFSIDDDPTSNDGHNCSECVKEGKNCFDHGSCTIDPDVCSCCGNDLI